MTSAITLKLSSDRNRGVVFLNSPGKSITDQNIQITNIIQSMELFKIRFLSIKLMDILIVT